MKNLQFMSSFKKDMPLKYSIYDEIIQEYAKVGNNINTELVKKFVLAANPKISRQQNYMPKITNILKSIVPHFKNNSNFYA